MMGSRLKRKARKEATNNDLTRRLVSVTNPSGGAAEAYRGLRTNLLYAVIDEPLRVVLVSSPGIAEGKSTTCANLAAVLAQAENNTLLMDCDFRRPTQHRIFGMRNFQGSVNVLAGESDLQGAVQETSVPNLKLLTVGSVPPNPAELLGSRRFADLMKQVRQQFDYVVLDAPPIQLVSDAAILATHADGTLLVLDAQRTRKASLREAVHSLQTVGASVLGTIMNNVDTAESYYPSSYT